MKKATHRLINLLKTHAGHFWNRKGGTNIPFPPSSQEGGLGG